jgi:hypothetical protein
MGSKRTHVPTGDTPGKPKQKISNQYKESSSRKSLFGGSEGGTSAPSWNTKETSALVQYICLYWEDAHTNKWPTTKNRQFWNGCADAVNKTCNSSRTGIEIYICTCLFSVYTVYMYMIV